MPPQLIFGTAMLGRDDMATDEASFQLLEYVYSHGIRTLDTAAFYPPDNAGASECIIGRFVSTHPEVKVWTKTNVSGDISGRGDLSRENVLESARMSRERLGIDVEIYFPHVPDAVTPCTETVTAFKDLREKRFLKEMGLSNCSVKQAGDLYDACVQEGFPTPSIAQWQYNPFSRSIEKDLIPFYRSKGIGLAAYSPLAGGFLTGRVTDGNIAKSRFDPEHMPLAKTLYVDVYDKSVFHHAFRMLRTEAEKYGISVLNASLRWLLHHSALTDGDAIILAATKMAQAREIFEGLEADNGILPETMVQAFDRAWDMVKHEQVSRHGLES